MPPVFLPKVIEKEPEDAGSWELGQLAGKMSWILRGLRLTEGRLLNFDLIFFLGSTNIYSHDFKLPGVRTNFVPRCDLRDWEHICAVASRCRAISFLGC